MDGGLSNDADGVGQLWYLVLAQEDLTNQVEGHALMNKATTVAWRFLIEEVVCRYGCVGEIVVGRGELDAQEAEELFNQLGGQTLPHHNI